MIKQLITSTYIILITATALSGQTEYLPKKVYEAYRVEVPPTINGVFDDEAWSQGTWTGGFVQHEPYEGRPPSQQTEFKLAYDDMNIYVAVKALDSAPDSITNRMSRRDNADGDMVFVVFDSYHDLRTGFIFGVSSAGVRFDMIQSNNGQNEDTTWDPIWLAKAQVHNWGWAAEMKIPFTQLRFNKNSESVWGFELARQIFRENELSLWHPIPRNAPGFIHAIGELDGLQEIEPRKQLDLTPYGIAALETYEPEEGNPYADGSDPKFNIGLDGKVGVTNNLTLDFTINPDFGQVEADPSEVNLTAFETYFEEKRPFFIEGANITSFNVGLGDGDVGNDNLFYSRRIGRRPQGYPSLEDGEYASVPRFTRILGAAKLTGKTEKGLSVGIMEALTADTKATTDQGGAERKETIEPLTNYALVRVQKDYNEGNSIIGGAVTSTIRRLDGTDMDYLHQNATTAGVDFTQYFKDRNYTLNTAFYMSNVQGSTDAISETQQASARYFQRPDADYVELDESRTALSGVGGKIEFGKIGGNWNWLYMNIFKTPGVELNDMGFNPISDNILNVLWTGYNFTEPFSIFRSLRLNTNVNISNDFGGTITGIGNEYNVNANFKNFWHAGIGGGYGVHQVSNRMLRGGPSMYLPNEGRLFSMMMTDDRKAISGGFFGSAGWGSEAYYQRTSIGVFMTFRPTNTLSISLKPSYSKNDHELQYVSQTDMNGDARYIFGTIDQKVLSMSLRVNFSITPDLTIQYWGQPFTASGDYSDFKMITNSRADEYSDRYHNYTSDQIRLEDEVYYVDENVDGNDDYGFDNPDFTWDEWLSNLVIRWEFLPGSTAYLVWSQTRDYYLQDGGFDVWESMNDMFKDGKPNNTFLLKFSYRFGLR